MIESLRAVGRGFVHFAMQNQPSTIFPLQLLGAGLQHFEDEFLGGIKNSPILSRLSTMSIVLLTSPFSWDQVLRAMRIVSKQLSPKGESF